jgi:hypothetical protein
MSKSIRYADLWALLRNLGFDCDALDKRNHRICEYGPTRIVLHDYLPTTPVHDQILVGVRLQLDNGAVMSRADFDQWVAKQTNVKTAGHVNGAKMRRTVKRTSDIT